MTTQQMTLVAPPAAAARGSVTGLARVKRTYPTSAVRTGEASNDRAFAPATGDAAELEAWSRRAAAASGFGDAADATGGDSAGSYQHQLQARAARHAGLSAAFAVMTGTVIDAAHRALASWRRARDAHATYRALSRLDARTLRDVGLDRSELRSVAAELAGEADRSRIQALRSLRMLSVF
ncbi:MAG TPA: DUF1127 domain-containing protein [Burkholderiaceae bacterium]|nr:DUF1127 domain-containing protein [Burkholderiaceae bacterium]HQR71389.1 DUF1127 domain-containing protein [Burkholderiaceae bacterium]